MRLKVLLKILCIATALVGCNSSDIKLKTTAEKKADELSKRNPIKKGRYLCYYLSAGGDKTAPELLVLSDDMYQVNDVTGKYTFDAKQNAIKILDGPLYQPNETITGFYTPKGSTTAGGGKTLDIMIEFKKQTDTDSGSKKTIMQCNCEDSR